ncbi:MAG: shikimate kinase, partial [Clostridia bacterium]
DIDKLDKSNRPLSADINALIDMYEKRKLLYENSADIIVNNNNSVDIICERICEKLNEIANN